MITREDVADLQPGDVVELRDYEYPGVSVRGPLRDMAGVLVVGPFRVRHADGEPLQPLRSTGALTVVSRAPRPLYVNHPRTEPVPSDVVRDADDVVWLLDRWGKWQSAESECQREHEDVGLPVPRTLLVDGETGQVVP